MINKLPQITIVYDRHKTASPIKKATLEIRVSHNYRQKYISTGIMLYPNQWKNGKVVNCDDILQISQILDAQLKNIRKALYDMVEEGNIDLTLLPARLRRIENLSMTFIDYCTQRASIRKFGKRKDTQERYDRFLRLFKKWGRIVSFTDVDEQNILSYDKYLTGTGMKPYSKWNNYHRFLNSFIMDAIEEGYMKRNPYKWISIHRCNETKSIGKCLTPEEFHLLKVKPMPTKKLERVRDLFVFQTYTCLSYTDLRDFDSRAVQEVKGMKVYIGCRNKTSRTFTIPLLSPALDILHKYEGILPIISNVKYNEHLKLVAQAAGIDKPISTHWARHTGATLLLNEGVDMRIVSKICGHSSIKITEQVYAKLLDETVVDAISSIDI